MKESATDARGRGIGDEPTAISDAPSALPHGALAPGTMVSEYRVERELGRGGMGVVYAGTQPVIGKRVAIKVLSAAASSDPALGRRFVEEARAVNKIGHPSIIDIFAFGQLDDGRLYFVMEYLEGETFADLLERDKPEEREVCRLLAQVADALAAAHGERIVHRDLKPENLWVARPKHGDPFIKVLDFGIAKLLAGASQGGLTATGAVIGTPYYMAPEQCMGGAIDARADIYALGVILYRALTGALPFTGSSFAEIVSQHVVRAPAPPSELNAQLSPRLAALMMACLEKDPARRPQTAAAVAAELRATAQRAPQARAATGGWRIPAAIALVTLLLVAGALVALFDSTPSAPPVEANRSAPIAAEPAAPVAPAPPVATPTAPPVAEPSAAPEPRAEPKRPKPGPKRGNAEGLIEENPF